MWLSRENDPEAQQTMEMMIDLAEGSSKPLLQQQDAARVLLAVNAYALHGFTGAQKEQKSKQFSGETDKTPLGGRYFLTMENS